MTHGGTLFIDRAALREAITGNDDFSGIVGAIDRGAVGDFGTGGNHTVRYSDSSVVDPARLPVVYCFSP